MADEGGLMPAPDQPIRPGRLAEVLGVMRSGAESAIKLELADVLAGPAAAMLHHGERCARRTRRPLT